MDNESGRQTQPESYVPPQHSNTIKHSRAVSTVAQSFAADLDSMFGKTDSCGVEATTQHLTNILYLSFAGLSSGTATLSQNVEEVKANVSSGQAELEELEAKLRETEQRLAKVSRQNSPSRQASSGAAQTTTSPLGQKPTYPDDRPPTGQQQPTNQASSSVADAQGQANGRDDYVMVDSSNQR